MKHLMKVKMMRYHNTLFHLDGKLTRQWMYVIMLSWAEICPKCVSYKGDCISYIIRIPV